MRDSFKILAEKYSLVESDDDRSLGSTQNKALGFFNSMIEIYPDKDKFAWWILNIKLPAVYDAAQLPAERDPVQAGYMIEDMISDLKQEIREDPHLDSDEKSAMFEDVFKNIQEELRHEYVQYYILNKDNPGVPPNF